MTSARAHADTWPRAYRFAVANAALFALLSALDAALSVDSVVWQAAVAVVFFGGSVLAFIRLLRTSGGLAFIGFFVLGAGVFFGFGSAYATVAHAGDFDTFFPPWAQADDLRQINLLNSVSALLVLLAAWPICAVPGFRRASADSAAQFIEAIAKFQSPALAASLLIMALQILTFPQPSNMLVNGALHALTPLPLICVMMTFARARRSHLGRMLCAVLIVVVSCALGVLREDKSATMLAPVALAGGLWLNRATRGVAVAVVVVGIVAFFAVLGPLTADARRHSGAGEVTGLSNAVICLEEGWDDFLHARASLREDQPFLARFSAAPVQAFLIDQRREGRPGDSLADAWQAAVPRVLWPDKPNITRFGQELYGLAENTGDAHSALAPTYSAEAYWDAGWFGVAAISLLIGLELGWLTRKWLLLAQGRTRNLGILILAVPAALLAFWVENWIAAAYIGGWLTLAILISILDAVLKVSAPRAPSKTSPGLLTPSETQA